MPASSLPAHVPADKAVRLPLFAREVVRECPQETLIPEMHRTLGPITYVTNIFPGDKPGWLLTGYDDTMTMLRDAGYTQQVAIAYTDSSADLPLLQAAANPVVVNPKAGSVDMFRKVLPAGTPILNWGCPGRGGNPVS